MQETNIQNDIKKEKTKKTPKQKVFFGLKIAGNVVFYSVLVFLFLLSIANINAGAGKNGIPNIFGTGFLSVQTNSMKASMDKLNDEYKNYKIKPFAAGDLVVVEVLNDSKRQCLQVGDVVTFQATIEGNVVFDTHRIVLIDKEEDKIVRIITEGDMLAANYGTVNQAWVDENGNSKVLDYEEADRIQIFGESNLNLIYGKAKDVWYGGGKVADNIRNNWLLYFVLPVAVLLIIEIFFVIKNFMDYRNEKRGITKDGKVISNQPIDMEAERERMKQELLAELRAQQMKDESIARANVDTAPVIVADDIANDDIKEVENDAKEEIKEDNNSLANEEVVEENTQEETVPTVEEDTPVEDNNETLDAPVEAENNQEETVVEEEVLPEVEEDNNVNEVEDITKPQEDEVETQEETQTEETSVEKTPVESEVEETKQEDDASHPALEEDEAPVEEKPKKTRSTTKKSTTEKKTTSTKTGAKKSTAKKTTKKSE